jgi:hypothetical protein
MNQHTHIHGEVREWPNRAVSKTVDLKGSVGSNPTLSAITSLVIDCLFEVEPQSSPKIQRVGFEQGAVKGRFPLYGVTEV